MARRGMASQRRCAQRPGPECGREGLAAVVMSSSTMGGSLQGMDL